MLKVGLLANINKELKDIPNLALEEINDQNVFIVPRDAGFMINFLKSAVHSIKKQVKILKKIILNEFDIVKKFNDLVFISFKYQTRVYN